MPPLLRTLPLCGLLVLLLPPATLAQPDEPRRFAVRLPADAGELAEKVLEGAFHRWIVPNDERIELVVGPDATGDVIVEARVFPIEQELAERLADLPVRLQGEAIVLDGTTYRDDRHALAVRLPAKEANQAPGAAGRPHWVVSGYRAEATASLVDQVLISASGRRWGGMKEDLDYRLREHRWAHRSGRWQRTDSGRIIAADERDDFAERAATYAALRPIRQPHVVLRVPSAKAGEKAEDPEMTALAADLDAAAAAMARRIPLRLETPVEVVVESDFTAQGRHLGAIGAAVLAEDGSLHLVHHPDDLFAYRHELARALLRRAAQQRGELPALPPWLEDGAALYLSGDWYGRPFGDWAAELAALDALPTAAELLAGERQGDSSAVLWPPLAAALVARLPGATLEEKLATLPAPPRVAEILDGLKSPTRPQVAPTVARAAARRPRFQRGASFAMANGLEVGYHAPGIDDQLRRLRHLGVDSVSLMPFAYQPSSGEPELRFLNRSPDSETDVGTVYAARRARDHDFTVLWKPHIWVSHDSWPGEIAMTSEAHWADWWRVYRRFVLHHAVLAEWTGCELFSIGVELGRTVEREAEWRSLIGAVRRVFSGRLTYSGNWAGDYEIVPFWDALDFVGVDAYFPLSDRADAEPAALANGARRVVRQLRAAAERFGKPVLLTEVGFAARRGTWIEPHQEGGEVSEAHQALAYRALLDALGRPPWLAGLYVWKVFSHSDAENRERPDFRILDREAEAVVRGYFREPRPAPLATSQR